jgi:hypothetical protein
MKDTERKAHDDRCNEDMHLYIPELHQIAGAYTVSRKSMLSGLHEWDDYYCQPYILACCCSMAQARRKAGRPSPSAVRLPLG